MISLFERQLKMLEYELLDLKTSHQLGAGSTKFYAKDIYIPSASTFSLQIKIADEEPMPPLLMMIYRTEVQGFYSYGYFEIWTNNPSNRTYTYGPVSGSSSADWYARIISSSVIESVTVL